MICVSIIEPNVQQCFAVLQKCEMAELRFDKINATNNDIERLCSVKIPIIATCRKTNLLNDNRRFEILNIAAQNGAKYIDIEYESDTEYRENLIKLAHANSCKTIISYHNFEDTPSVETLTKIIEKSKIFGADLVKITTTANSMQDAAHVLSLYQNQTQIIAFAMGNVGKITRLASLALGAPFAYAALDDGLEAAPGQISAEKMSKILKLLNLQ